MVRRLLTQEATLRLSEALSTLLRHYRHAALQEQKLSTGENAISPFTIRLESQIQGVLSAD